MRIDPDTCRDPDLLIAEVKRLRRIIDATHPHAYEALERLAELEADRPQPDRPEAIQTDDPPDAVESVGDSAACDRKSVETEIPPAWLQRPYWVDPPSGWQYGFPRLYDPQADGDLTEWMIRNGYPEKLARQGLACTFTACTENGET